jgi:CspA family cold shock protein
LSEAAKEVVKEQGRVRWFNNSKGFGFIDRNGNKDDSIFVHFSQVQSEGYKSLMQNEEVVFEVEETHKGLMAVNVSPKRLAVAAAK